jgi:predicted kinase
VVYVDLTMVATIALRRTVVQGPIGEMMRLPPLVVTGGPAVGKSVTGRSLAEGRPGCAFIDVDDVRQLVVSGAAAPWEGLEGQRQQVLGVTNACSMARNFLAVEIEVVIADVLTPETSRLYRSELPGCLIVHLKVSLSEAMRRAASRKVWLTDEEFGMLHDADATNPPYADHHIRVDALDFQNQTDKVASLWTERR